MNMSIWNNALFSTKMKKISGATIAILVHNVRSLSKQIDDIVSHRIINNDIVRFAETQFNLSESTWK